MKNRFKVIKKKDYVIIKDNITETTYINIEPTDYIKDKNNKK